jgi:hypothetical protein
MADIESVEKRLLDTRKKAKSDKKMAEIVMLFETILEKLNK